MSEKKISKWYTIEKVDKVFVLWFNKEYKTTTHGSYGSYGIFSSLKKKDVIEYCKEHNIKVE